jgi:hypothetical protein
MALGSTQSLNINEYLMFWEKFVALEIQHEKSIRHIVICDLPDTYNIFSTLTHKRHTFLQKKKSTKKNVCFDFLYNICLKHLILKWPERYIFKNVYCFPRKVPDILVRF